MRTSTHCLHFFSSLLFFLRHQHRSPINQISIEEKGEYVGSCSDYQVVILELYSRETVYSASFDKPLKTLCLDPTYGSSSARRFVLGEADRLMLYERNILGRYRSSCLQHARGVIRATTWRTTFIAWASDLCIKIYDVAGRALITHIDREKETDYRIKADRFQCSFCWKDNLTLLTAWGGSIKMCCIKRKAFESELSLTSIGLGSSSSGTAGNGGDRGQQPRYYVELGEYTHNHTFL